MSIVAQHVSRGVRVLSPRDSVAQAALTMEELNVGLVPVCVAGRLVGMVTERDLAVFAARGRSAASTPLGVVMSVKLQTCFVDETLDEVMSLLRPPHPCRLPVIDRNHLFVGMLSVGTSNTGLDSSVFGAGTATGP